MNVVSRTLADLRRRAADLRQRTPAILTALVVGIPAGYFCDWLNLPIPWMIGPMVIVAALNLSGVAMDSPPYRAADGARSCSARRCPSTSPRQ